MKGNFITLMKVTLASSVMGVVVYSLNEYVLTDWNIFLKMIVVILIGSSIYFLLITLLKVKESKVLVNFLLNKIRPKQT